MLIAPLLSLVLDSIQGYYHAIESQSTDSRLGLSRAHIHGLDSRNSAESLHKTSCKIVMKVTAVNINIVN